jgi:hypothetical protein
MGFIDAAIINNSRVKGLHWQFEFNRIEFLQKQYKPALLGILPSWTIILLVIVITHRTRQRHQLAILRRKLRINNISQFLRQPTISRLYPRSRTPPFPRSINNTLKRIFRAKITRHLRGIIENAFNLISEIREQTFRFRHISHAIVDFFCLADEVERIGLTSTSSILGNDISSPQKSSLNVPIVFVRLITVRLFVGESREEA